MGSFLAPLQMQAGVNSPAIATTIETTTKTTTKPRRETVSPDEAKAIAQEAWLYAYAPCRDIKPCGTKPKTRSFPAMWAVSTSFATTPVQPPRRIRISSLPTTIHPIPGPGWI